MSLSPLHVILDADVSSAHGWSIPDLARACLHGGALVLQVRAKHALGRELLDLSKTVVAAARPFGALVIVNDRPDVARVAGAAGVHVGQDDLSPAQARAILGDEAIVGRSTHSEELVVQALHEPATYVAVGPVYATATKTDTGCDPLGLDLVRFAAARARDHEPAAPRPIVAIGGITLERAPAVIAAGAAAVAVVSDMFTGGDPEARTRAFLSRLA